MLIVHALTLLATWAATPLWEEEEAFDPFAAAIANLEALGLEEQQAIADSIAATIDASKDGGIAKLLALRDRARKELPIKPAEPPKFFDTAVYAPTQGTRAFVDAASSEASRQAEAMRTWENVPPFYVTRIRYDFAADCGREGPAPTPAERVSDFLYGAIPDQDLLTAWIQWRLDTNDGFNRLAEHFAHAYCDLSNACFPNVTLYDAIASTQGMDMPDTDVIAFARNLANDDSFRSPIPANSKREALYEKINTGFSDYFRYRTTIEYAAWIFVHPDCNIRADHAGLREFYWTLFAKTKDTFDNAAKELKSFKDREAFKDKVNAWRKSDGSLVQGGVNWRASKNAVRWAVNALTIDHLKARGLWQDERPPAEVENPPPAEGGGSKKEQSNSSEPGSKETTMLVAGEQAPDFSVPDETGKLRTLSEFRGKTVVLWFYPKASTPG